MATVTIRYWAAAKDAAGVAEERLDAGTLAEALAEASSRHAARLGEVIAASSLLIDGAAASKGSASATTLRDGMVIEVLPQFAGG